MTDDLEVIEVAEAIVDVARAEVLSAGLAEAAARAVQAVDELREHRRLTEGELELLEVAHGALDVVTCFMRGGTVRPCL